MARFVKKSEQLTDLENSVNSAFSEFEAGCDAASKPLVSSLKIEKIKEITSNGVRVVIVTVPYKQISAYKTIHHQLVQGLEKKVAGSQFVIIGKRRAFPIEPISGRRYKAIRPVKRTLRSVQSALLEDIAFPTTIVGKHTHYDLKGGQATRVMLDGHDSERIEERLPALSAAYTALTGLKTTFEVAKN